MKIRSDQQEKLQLKCTNPVLGSDQITKTKELKKKKKKVIQQQL